MARDGAQRAPDSRTTDGLDLMAVVDRIHDGVFAVDRDWTYTFVNEAAARLVDRTVPELLGANVWEQFPTAAGSTFERMFRQAMDAQEVVEFEEYFDAVGLWYAVRAFPSPDGLTVIFRDVTRVRSLLRERRTLLDRLTEAEERERARIAADVHDDSVQALGVVRLRLELVRRHLGQTSPALGELMDGLEEQVAVAIDRLRTLLFKLEPTDVEASLEECVRAAASFLFVGSGIDCQVAVHGAATELPAAERLQALRIVKEALSNTRAHADAETVRVCLRTADEGVEVEITDDGTSGDPARFSSAPGHRGLATMRDRAAVVGGWCTLEAALPHGTCVRFFVPRARPW